MLPGGRECLQGSGGTITKCSAEGLGGGADVERSIVIACDVCNGQAVALLYVWS
jgi:hypothetical protein